MMSALKRKLSTIERAIQRINMKEFMSLDPSTRQTLQTLAGQLETLRNLPAHSTSTQNASRQTNFLDTFTLTETELQFARAGQKIYAIKAVRERTNLPLKEAKDLVEKYM